LNACALSRLATFHILHPACKGDCVVAQVRRSDVMSAWSGIRPLATDPHASDTASASRDHVLSMDTDGMITIAGRLLTCTRMVDASYACSIV